MITQDQVLNWLTHTPPSDMNFKGALPDATLETLNTALDHAAKASEKTRYRAIGAEITRRYRESGSLYKVPPMEDYQRENAGGDEDPPADGADPVTQRARNLLHTSVDDCKNSLAAYTPNDLPVLQRALELHATGVGYKGATRRTLLERAIKRLNPGGTGVSPVKAKGPKTKDQGPKTILVPLTAIVPDHTLQIRVANDPDQVENLMAAMEEGAPIPPIDLFLDAETNPQSKIQNPKYYLGDGWHRYHAALSLKRKEIPAIIHPGGRAAALKHALGANASHGLRRTNKDKRKAVEVALREYPKLSDRAIADLCKVSHTHVKRTRAEVEQCSTSRIGQDGKEYPVNGKPKAQQIDFWKVLNESFSPVKDAVHGTIESPIWLDEGWPRDDKLTALKTIEEALAEELTRVREFKHKLLNGAPGNADLPIGR